jgi:two-component system, OmpR family, response regulator
MRVLYVDDDRVNALLFSEACRIAGHVQIETAGSGAEALDLVDTFMPDLLVLDLHLPDTDGFALLAQLRARAGRPALPAALCSADDPAEIAERARAAGFEHCWSKPVDLTVVLATLARHESAAVG